MADRIVVGPEMPKGTMKHSENGLDALDGEVRSPKTAPLADGPKRGPKGQYLPSKYAVTTEVNGKVHTTIVEDR